MTARLAIRPGDNLTAFEVFSHGELLVTGTSTGEVTIWSVPALKKLATVDLPCKVLAFGVSKDGKRLCYGGEGGAIGLLSFDKKTLKREKSAALPAIHIESIRFSQDEKYLIASSESDAKAYLLKPNLDLITWMFQPGNAVKNAIVSEKNNYIAHAGQQFWIWDLDKTVLLRSRPSPTTAGFSSRVPLIGTTTDAPSQSLSTIWTEAASSRSCASWSRSPELRSRQEARSSPWRSATESCGSTPSTRAASIRSACSAPTSPVRRRKDAAAVPDGRSPSLRLGLPEWTGTPACLSRPARARCCKSGYSLC